MGDEASSHLVEGVMFANASKLRADLSFSCAEGAFRALRIAFASSSFLVASDALMAREVF